MLRSYCICRCGKVRGINQDRAGGFTAGQWTLAFVADGMGGHLAGECASETVAQACTQWWNHFINLPQRPEFLQSVEELRALLGQCHGKIAQIVPSGEICGTTLVLLWISGNDYAVFSVGDSRCYAIYRRLLFPGMPVQLTCDDVFRDQRHAGKLMRALGPGSGEFSLQTGSIQTGMAFALCSDGVYKFCPELLQLLKKLPAHKKPGDLAKQIAEQVENNGSPDNYSLVLIQT